MAKYIFYRTESMRWYVDLPELINAGLDIDDLEMVLGADEMLDLLSNGEDRITLNLFIIDKPDNCRCVLTKIREIEDGDGADYQCAFEGKIFNVWLCGVTKYVFGDYPDEIYII